MEEWIIYKEFRFEAAHILPHHGGKCARLHGHSCLKVNNYQLIII